MSIVNRGARWTLAAVVAGALGFGASQAVAAPSAEGGARVCNSSTCPQVVCKCSNGQCVDRETGYWCFAR